MPFQQPHKILCHNFRNFNLNKAEKAIIGKLENAEEFIELFSLDTLFRRKNESVEAVYPPPLSNNIFALIIFRVKISQSEKSVSRATFTSSIEYREY